MIDQSAESQMTTEGHGNGFANNAPGMPVATESTTTDER